MWGIEIGVMLVMIGINSVFAAYEIALASISAGRLQQRITEKVHGAAVALYMKQNMEASLAVVQLGITLVGAIAAAVGGAGAEEKIAPVLVERLKVSGGTADVLAIVMVVLPLTMLTIMFGELIPKVFALRNAEWVCLKLSPFMRWFSFSVWPLVWLFETIVMKVMSWGERNRAPGDRHSETAELQDLRATANLARASRLLSHREEGIILGATQMQTRQIGDIQLPAEHISMFAIDATLEECLVAAHLDMHTRFPVAERRGDPQSIVGYVNVKDILAAMRMNPEDASLRGIVRPLPTLPETMPIREGLERILMEHTHMALVRDGSNRVTGLITLEDILEELVGEIGDEYDRLPTHLTAAGHSWIVGGGLGLDKLRAATGIDLLADSPDPEVRTVNEWILGHMPQELQGGEAFERAIGRIVVRKIRRKKVQEALIVPRSAPIRP